MSADPNSPPSCEAGFHFEGQYYGGEWVGSCKINPPCQRGYHADYNSGYLQCIHNPPIRHFSGFYVGFGLAALTAMAVKSLIRRRKESK